MSSPPHHGRDLAQAGCAALTVTSPWTLSLQYRGIIEGRFIALALDERFAALRRGEWSTNAPLDALRAEVLSESADEAGSRQERVVRLGSAIAYLELNDVVMKVHVAAADRAACDAVFEEIRAALPRKTSLEMDVSVRFWWWQVRGAESVFRTITAPSWDELSHNYSERSRPSLAHLMDWKAPPSAGGRLILWHGPPGTGKTTALRALAWRWRPWAGFHFVTDPEQFLSNPSYLMQALTERGDGLTARWRILVLEDSGEYLAPDAKRATGQGLSRLLNVCDGVLGQGARCLVLVTTNEALSSPHPALSRPGRCVAETEFHDLTRSEVEIWCAEHRLAVPPVDQASIADLFAHAQGRQRITERKRFGFSGASQ